MADVILTTVKPCAKCGACDRNSGGKCKACVKVNHAAWRLANPDKTKARTAAWIAANPDRYKERVKAYLAANHGRLKAADSARYFANRDRISANKAARRAANPEKFKAANAAWSAANPERKKAKNAAWFAANPEASRIYKQNRRAKAREAGGSLSIGLAAKLFSLQRGLCPCCNLPLGIDYHLDHKMPIALGGQNSDENMQLLRATCNMQKSAKHPVDFMQSRGFLL